ncbi:LptF/LptG family permease [Aureimonas leprariae]|nr:LptF/LptG family permease [Aureimonas leprariae]
MSGRRSFGVPTILDRYLLGLVLKPLGLGVGVLLVGLLLARVLRLLNVLASSGSTELGILAALTASLVPHYLGLALTAAFVIAVFVAMIRLGDGSELDALLSSGLSLGRIAVPFVALGAVLAVFSFVLYGWLNPLSRYDYRSVLYSATAVVAYRTDIRPGSFVNAGRGATITADDVDAGSKRVRGVFIHQIDEGGRERITTATSGEIAPGPDGVHLKLILEDGVSIIQDPNGPPLRTQFRHLNFQTEIEYAGRPYRPRGSNEREMTLGELWEELRAPTTDLGPRIVEAELIDRIIRPLALVFMPLLAIPLSLATKRGSRAAGLVAGAIVLLTFNSALQFGKDLAAAGHGPVPVTALAPFAAFVALSLWLFLASARHPTEAPLSRLIGRLSDFGGGVFRLVRPRRQRAE